MGWLSIILNTCTIKKNKTKVILFIHSTSLLQDKFFISKHLTDIKRVRWYPGSPEDNHLVVLTNNKNCLRLFKVDRGTGKLVSIWRLGPQTSRILASLGDTAVDFDFAPPILLGSRIQSDPSIMWPILVLQGNGKITRYNIIIVFPHEFFSMMHWSRICLSKKTKLNK